MTKAYHGSDPSKLESIIEKGFDLSLIGTGWGTTYGRGIYFSLDPKVANIYSGNTGYIIEADIRYIPYYLKKNYSPTNRRHRNELQKLREKAEEERYTCFVPQNREEIILFYPSDIISIKYRTLVNCKNI